MTPAEKILKKYTGKTIKTETLDTKRDVLAAQIFTAIIDVQAAETHMRKAAMRMAQIANKVEAYVNAEPGVPVKPLGTWGEVNGSDAGEMDGRIVRFHEAVKRLQTLVRLYTGPAL